MKIKISMERVKKASVLLLTDIKLFRNYNRNSRMKKILRKWSSIPNEVN